MLTSSARSTLGAALLLLVFRFSSFTQPAPVIKTHVPEAGGFVGASYGIDQARVMGGGNFVYSVTREIMPYAEVSYFPGIGRTTSVSGFPGATSTFSIPITDFNFGIHFRVLIPKSRVIPYGVFGVGGIHSPSRTVNVVLPPPFPPGSTQSFTAASSTDFATSFGGGLRIYATERLGFRGEFKAYRPTGAFPQFFYRATGGFFFQF